MINDKLIIIAMPKFDYPMYNIMIESTFHRKFQGELPGDISASNICDHIESKKKFHSVYMLHGTQISAKSCPTSGRLTKPPLLIFGHFGLILRTSLIYMAPHKHIVRPSTLV